MRAAFKEADHAETDVAEWQAGELIREGYWPAIKYRLGTKGKDRGYVERVENEQVGEVVFRVVYDTEPL